jgi:hypothetical protein
VSSNKYTVEEIKVTDLLVDPRVQRDGLNNAKVSKIEANFNKDALGIVTISRRPDRGLYIVDGWHRVEACKKLNTEYEITCHVYEGLTVPEEALMFLDLNTRTTPTQLEKFKVSLAAEDPTAILIDQITRSRSWKVDPMPAGGHIQAIGALYRIHNLSLKVNADPHLLDGVLYVISRAWGNNRHASQAVILEGIAQVLAEYGDRINLNTLLERLRDRKGGPRELHTNAQALANTRSGQVRNAVSELVVITYNKGARGKALHAWGKQN